MYFNPLKLFHSVYLLQEHVACHLSAANQKHAACHRSAANQEHVACPLSAANQEHVDCQLSASNQERLIFKWLILIPLVKTIILQRMCCYS